MPQNNTPCELAFLNRLRDVCPETKWYYNGIVKPISNETLLSTFWEMAEDWQTAVDWARAHPEDVSHIQPRRHKVAVDWIDQFPTPEAGVWVEDV